MRTPLIALAAIVAITAPAQAALAPGSKAVDFTVDGARAGQPVTVDLNQLLKKGPVVLYFFPAAFTSGCNAEAAAFAQQIDAFKAAGATVIGMSSDSVKELIPFSAKHCAGKFTVASASPALIAKYDATNAMKYKGKTIASRTSYVIAPDHTIVFAMTNSAPGPHIRDTLAKVQAMAKAK